MLKQYIYYRLRQAFFCLNKTRKISSKDYDFVTWITENVRKTTKENVVFLEKQQRIIKMAINKVLKSQHECTENQ